MGASPSKTQQFYKSNLDIIWSHSCIQGKRESFEDAYSVLFVSSENDIGLFSIFDGHYGKRAAKYASKYLHGVILETFEEVQKNWAQALVRGYLSLDRQLLDVSRRYDWQDGTTSLTMVVVEGDNGPTLHFANAGDCRAVVLYGENKVKQLTTDHSPQLKSEKRRIEKAGGTVKYGRIEAKLSVSRGFGDRQFKEPKALVIPNPEIISVRLTNEIEFVILACDGLWGWVSNEQAARFVKRELSAGKDVSTVSRELVDFAYSSGSSDNISVIIVCFKFAPGYQNPLKEGPSYENDSSTTNLTDDDEVNTELNLDTPQRKVRKSTNAKKDNGEGSSHAMFVGV